MKSEKAKAILSASSITDSLGYEYLLMSCAGKAVECAEQEAEERMRQKAIEAFCDECACFEACICCLPAGVCDRQNNFIQKLNEE